MDADTALVLGIVIAGFSIPSIFSAFSDRRAPRASVITVMIAGGLIVYAFQNHPGGYKLEDVPNAFVRVIADYL
jgi:hypothetical protein